MFSPCCMGVPRTALDAALQLLWRPGCSSCLSAWSPTCCCWLCPSWGACLILTLQVSSRAANTPPGFAALGSLAPCDLSSLHANAGDCPLTTPGEGCLSPTCSDLYLLYTLLPVFSHHDAASSSLQCSLSNVTVPAVREQATACFAAAVALLPLAQGTPMPPGLDTAQQQAWQHDRALLQQLINNSKVSRASHGTTTDCRLSQTISVTPGCPKLRLAESCTVAAGCKSSQTQNVPVCPTACARRCSTRALWTPALGFQ